MTSYNYTDTADESAMFTSSPTRSPTADVVAISYYVWVYLSPVVFFPGVIGNILTVVVMMRPAFRHTTTGIYLPLIAISDIITLFSGLLLDWLEWVGIINLKEFSVWTCRLHKFIFYTAGDVSIWLIVAFTLDRFVAVCFPLSKRVVCVPKRARYVAIAIIGLFTSKNVHEFWTRGLQYNKLGQLKQVCGLPADYYYFHAYVRPWIAFTLITAIPFAMILICNCLIVCTLVRAQRMRTLHVNSTASSGATGNRQATSSSYRQTTLMCLSVSFAFVACILPSIILLIGKVHWNGPETPASTRLAYKRAKAVNNMFVYVNHSINFILYCLTGQKFRDQLAVMFKKPAKVKASNYGLMDSGRSNTTVGQSGLTTRTETRLEAASKDDNNRELVED